MNNLRNKLYQNYNKALCWVKNNSIPNKGVVVSNQSRVIYPEVTGYLIPTLIEAGEYNLAFEYANFLCQAQQKNGSFLGVDNKEYIFDSGQALRGLLAASRRWPKFKTNAYKTAEYLIKSLDKNGQFLSGHDQEIPDGVFVYVLPSLIESAQAFRARKFSLAARKSLKYYKSQIGILDFNCLSHFYAYIIDGFIEMGERIFVERAVKNIFSSQKENGAIPAFSNSRWSCSVGTAQFAVIGYKMGLIEKADKAIDWLSSVQNKSGGFNGSYGFRASYFPKEEISWANKFFLDAVKLKISSFFDNYALTKFEKISNDDPRLKIIIKTGVDLNHRNILDAGCGNGRFAKKIKEKFPNAKIFCLDISKKLLDLVPQGFIKTQGNILNLPYKDDYFDFIYCVEALEHSLRPELALKELSRVLKDDGTIVIIDKNTDREGALETTSFEQWFSKSYITNGLKNVGIQSQSKILNSKKWDKDLFVAWFGAKNNNLDDRAWSNIIYETPINRLADKIQSGQFPAWVEPLIKNTNQFDSILELGSGSGELSAILAIYDRKVNLLDFSNKNTIYSKKLFNKLKIKGNFYTQDVLNKLSFKNNSIDWVFSSGLLEHFNGKQIISVLKESRRIARKGVISLVPNASSIFYRIGKYQMEKNGTWKYGNELPIISMRGYFEKIRLKNIVEYSIDPYHSLNFVDNPERIKDFYDSLPPDELNHLNQGYLLFTYGEK